MREIDFELLYNMFGNDCRNCAYFTPCDIFGCSCYILDQCLQALEIGFFKEGAKNGLSALNARNAIKKKELHS